MLYRGAMHRSRCDRWRWTKRQAIHDAYAEFGHAALCGAVNRRGKNVTKNLRLKVTEGKSVGLVWDE